MNSTDNTDIIPFNYHNTAVRTTIINNEPWFVTKDVCDILGLTNSSVAIQSLDEDEKGLKKVYTPGGAQEMRIINESDLKEEREKRIQAER